jgi:hypothetical protein
VDQNKNAAMQKNSVTPAEQHQHRTPPPTAAISTIDVHRSLGRCLHQGKEPLRN